MTDERAERAKLAQDYDPDPPRCLTCVYYRYERREQFGERQVTTRRGKVKTVRFRKKANPLTNPLVDRCTFGNFTVKRYGVCDEWHGRDGDVIATTENVAPEVAE